MPSTRNPVVIVNPGPGRLPTNTVPASALIFPPGGGSDAALQAHIVDPVDAHMASAIGQLGYIGATWGIAANGSQSAVTKLFDAANSRPTWVLDANPAAKADFVGPSALINALAAITSTEAPYIFLRPGDYDWTDATIISAVTIIGGGNIFGNPARIKNLAGDLRVGVATHFQNVSIQLSGKLKTIGFLGFGFNTFRDCQFDTFGDIEISTSFNYLENINGTSSTYITVSSVANTFKAVESFQLRVQIGSDFSVFDGMGFGSAKYPVNPQVSIESDHCTFSNLSLNDTTTTSTQLLISGSHNVISNVFVNGSSLTTGHVIDITGGQNKLSQIEVSGVGPSATSDALRVTGDGNEIDTLSLLSLSGYSAPLISLTSTSANNNLRNCKLDTISGQSGSFIKDAGTENEIADLILSNVTTPGSNAHAVELTGTRSKVTRASFDTLPLFNGILLYFNAAIGSVAEDILVNAVTLPAVNFSFLKMTGTACEVHRYQVNTIANYASPTSSMFLVDPVSSHCVLSNVVIDAVGSGSSITVPMLDIAGTAGTYAQFVRVTDFKVNGCFHTIATPLFRVNATNGARNITLEGFEVVSSIVVGNSLLITGSTSEPFNTILVRDSNFTGAGSQGAATPNVYVNACGSNVVFERLYCDASGPTNSYALKVLSSRNFTAKNCYFSGSKGQAAESLNSGAIFEDCEFAGGTGAAGSGIQLFRGYGHDGSSYPIAPLSLRNCKMYYSSSNCSPTSVAAPSPVIFFGGIDGVVTANHGPFDVDGLDISPDSSVTAQHRDSLIVAETTSCIHDRDSFIRNVVVDLKEIPWAQSGAARAVLTWVDTTASVFEMQGSGDRFDAVAGSSQTPSVKNLRVINLKEQSTAFVDQRIIVRGLGVIFDGVVIDGPTSGAHGTKWFSNSLVYLDQGVMTNLEMFPTSWLRIDTSGLVAPIVLLGLGAVLRDFVINIPSGSTLLTTPSIINSVSLYSIIEDGFITIDLAAGSHITGAAAAVVIFDTLSAACHMQGVTITSFQDADGVLMAGLNSTVEDNNFAITRTGTGPSLVRATGVGNRIIHNTGFNFAASGGLGDGFVAPGNATLIDGNSLYFTRDTFSPNCILSVGFYGRFTNNFFFNQGGTNAGCGIFTSGQGNNIMGNQLLGAGAGAGVVFIDTSTGGTSNITNNVVSEVGAGTGAITTAGSDNVDNNQVT
jgi:hypothetical protein